MVNFPPKQIADFKSEVLTLGVPDREGNIVLFAPETEVDPGVKIY